MNAHAMPSNPMIVDSAEKAVLGALLLSEHAFWQVNDRLRADHFHRKIHQRIYGAIKDVLEEGKKLSQTIVQSRLGDDAEEDGYSIAAYLAVLLTGAEQAELSALDFVDQVVDAGERRRLVRLGEAIIKAAQGEKDPTDIAAEAETSLMDVMQTTSPKRPRRLGEVAAAVMKQAFQARNEDTLPGFDTGLGPVDELLGRILPGDLGFILARQKDGKTALATQIGLRAAKYRPVLYIQKEMTAEQQAARELARESGVSSGNLLEGNLVLSDCERIADGHAELDKEDFWILDDAKMTLRQIRVQATAMRRRHGLGMLIVDQLDKVDVEGKFFSDFERKAAITAGLKVLAKELSIAVIILAQRTRTSQRRDDPVPHINDAYYPSVEKDADWIISPWRMETWLRDSRPAPDSKDFNEWLEKIDKARGKASIICLAHRRREAFEERGVRWNGAMTRFEEISG